MKRIILDVLLGEVILVGACVLYLYLGRWSHSMGLPVSPFVFDTFSFRDGLFYGGIAAILNLALVIPLVIAPPSGGGKLRFVALLIVTALSFEFFFRQLGYYLSQGSDIGLFVHETVQGVGIQFTCLAALWGFWVKVRRSTAAVLHSSLACLICFYFMCLSGTPFTYLGP